MNVVVDKNVPDSTYFRISDVTPYISGNSLVVYDGKGTRRSSWGAPTVTSTVVVNEDDFAAVHVGYFHKHRGGQGWFYFLNGARLRWNQLPVQYKKLVMQNRSKAPRWAKEPGSVPVEVVTDPTEKMMSVVKRFYAKGLADGARATRSIKVTTAYTDEAYQVTENFIEALTEELDNYDRTGKVFFYNLMATYVMYMRRQKRPDRRQGKVLSLLTQSLNTLKLVRPVNLGATDEVNAIRRAEGAELAKRALNLLCQTVGKPAPFPEAGIG